MHILRILDSLLVPGLVVVAIGFGFYIPLRLFGRPGFTGGVVVCSLFTLLFSMMGAYLFASWGEELGGSQWGVPVGAAVGSLSTAIAMNCFAGFIGRLFYKMLNH
jgi:hypothetical protein